VKNPTNGQQTTILDANDDLLAQAAVQGQTFFAASGDYGARESVDFLPTAGSPSFNPVLSVEDPAVQRYLTATGGTTLPGTQIYSGAPLPTGVTVTINIQQEQAWGWDYLAPLCAALGLAPDCEYPIGSSGGVSVYVQRPFYQWFVPGVVASVPGQNLYQLTPPPPELIAALPAFFPGRNVPERVIRWDPDHAEADQDVASS
jgi:kumamolisin